MNLYLLTLKLFSKGKFLAGYIGDGYAEMYRRHLICDTVRWYEQGDMGIGIAILGCFISISHENGWSIDLYPCKMTGFSMSSRFDMELVFMGHPITDEGEFLRMFNSGEWL